MGQERLGPSLKRFGAFALARVRRNRRGSADEVTGEETMTTKQRLYLSVAAIVTFVLLAGPPVQLRAQTAAQTTASGCAATGSSTRPRCAPSRVDISTSRRFRRQTRRRRPITIRRSTGI